MPKLFRSLTGKLALIQTSFMVVALASIAFTVWVSWQLEGGAGAINEAGRMRMMSYRMTLAHAASEPLDADLQRFDGMVQALREGDPSRPLFVPNTEACQQRLAEVASRWPQFRAALQSPLQPGATPALRAQADEFVHTVDGLVSAIELTIATRTALLGGLCFGLVVLVVGASVVFASGTYVWILQPLQRLRDGLAQMGARDFSVRVDERGSVSEFAELAQGFNQMADALQRSYGELEFKVAQKTADLAEQNERLAALYDVALLATQGGESMEALAQSFATKLLRIARADAAAVRLAAEDGERLLLLGQARLPAAMADAERCVHVGDCACGEHLQTGIGARVIPIRALSPRTLGHCEAAGYQTVIAVPMRTTQRTVGEVELFFYGERNVADNERQLLDALVGHVATQVENLRLAARDREMAVSEERNLLAQELHDSIAQSLAFLKIQVQLLRGAVQRQRADEVERVIGEIDAGVRESYADVRELLLHFRTRAGHEDIEHALRATLSKFELQSGLKAQLTMSGNGLPLPPDQQIQVLHIVQEALSNVRKHAKASRVELRVQQAPQWRFEVCDDGIGFDPINQSIDETHVGLRIMRERAARIGAELRLTAPPEGGSCVSLSLPPGDTGRAADTAAQPGSIAA